MNKMLLTARIAGFLLLFAFVTLTLSIAFSNQDRDNHAAGECNLVFSDRKAKQSTIENVNLGRKMGSHDYINVMKERRKENGEKYTRKSRMVKSRVSYEARLVAFNADYKGPRHHPPKNN